MVLPCEQDGTSTDFEEHFLELRGGERKKGGREKWKN